MTLGYQIGAASLVTNFIVFLFFMHLTLTQDLLKDSTVVERLGNSQKIHNNDCETHQLPRNSTVVEKGETSPCIARQSLKERKAVPNYMVT